jgi:uncharacterized membrane protein YvlD (DUF360 family)
MIRILVRILLTALLFSTVFQALDIGVHFNGPFWPTAVGYAFVFGIVAWFVDLLIGLAAVAFSIVTLGLGLILVWLAQIFAFWLVPAIELQVFAHFFPQHFTTSGWGSAIIAGLLLLAVNWLTKAPRSAPSGS